MTELMLNPRLHIYPIVVDGRVTAYSLAAPIKGRGRQLNLIEVGSGDTGVLEVLDGLVRADADLEVDETIWPALIDLGVLVGEHEVAAQIEFSCRPVDDGRAAPADLAVNPEVEIVAFGEFAARHRELAMLLEPCARIAVVADPVTGARLPCWLDDRDAALIRRVTTGEVAPAQLARGDARRLTTAGVLVDPRAVAAARQEVTAAQAQFARHGYAVLRRTIPPIQRAALQRYYQRLVSEGHIVHGDDQVSLRSAQHNERLMHYYHHQLCGLFAQITARPIKPSYGYFGAYRRGAVLDRHRDREQCKFTASLLIDYACTPADDPVWPLYLELPATGETVAAMLDPGDCLVFCGTVQPHYRRELRADRSTSLLFHYVDEAFSGSLQ